MITLSFVHISLASSREAFEQGKKLILEYQAWLGVDLCFQGFQKELDELPQFYGPPKGALLLATSENETLGCVGLKPLTESCGEMKRLFVREHFRGLGVGQRLVEAFMKQAILQGYTQVRLDTLERLESALSMYRSMGFMEIAPYYHNPEPGVVYMQADLDTWQNAHGNQTETTV